MTIEKLNAISPDGVPNAKFPTNNEWGIPLLRMDRQADFLDMPCEVWGSKSRKGKIPGTVNFYTADYRFNRIWDKPDQVVQSGCISAIEPNISLSLDSDRAYVLATTYMKRWITRYWQERGIRIFVDLNIPTGFRDISLLGVPYGWNAYATRGYNDRIEGTILEWQLAQEHSGINEPLFVVYGGGAAVERVAMDYPWIYINEMRDTWRGRKGDANIAKAPITLKQHVRQGI